LPLYPHHSCSFGRGVRIVAVAVHAFRSLGLFTFSSLQVLPAAGSKLRSPAIRDTGCAAST